MKTIDVRLTLTPEALGYVLAQLRRTPPGVREQACFEAAAAMEACAQYQRIVRDSYETGKPLAPRLALAAKLAKILPPT